MYGESWITQNKEDNILEFNKALNSYLYFKKDSLDILNTLLKNNPKFIMAYCFKGFLLLLSRDSNNSQDLINIIQFIEKNKFNLNKKILKYIDVLKKWNSGNIKLAQDELINILLDDPKDILAFRLYHFNQIFLGLNKNYLKNHIEIKKNWNDKDEFYPLVLGMVSYALEESNMYVEAESYAKESLNISNKDLWSIHAMCHLHDSHQENFKGIKIFKDNKIEWDLYGPMKRHLWWHKSLFYYYQKNYKECVILYDDYVMIEDYHYLDFCNSVSLLIRLRIKGIDIGTRLEELKKFADYFLKQNTLPFIDFHLLLFYYYFENQNFDYFLCNEFKDKYFDSDYEESYNKSLKPLIDILINKKIENIDIVSNSLANLGGSFAQREIILLQLIDINKGKRNDYTQIIKDKIFDKKKLNEYGYI